jgi:formate C-acetyltransferase
VANRKRIRFELPKLAASLAPQVALTSLRALGWSCRLRPALRDELRWIDSEGIRHDLDFSINFRTADGAQQVWVRVRGARVRSGVGALEDAEACVEFEEDDLLRRFLSQRESPDLLSWMSDQNVRVTGPCSHLAKFVQILGASHLGSRPLRRRGRWPSDPPEDGELEILARCGSPKPFGTPTGARFLSDAAMASWTLDDFPRLGRSLRRLLAARPRISSERAVALTESASRLVNDDAQPVVVARARQLAHALRSKKVVVRQDDVVLGTTTEHDLGVVVYPELSHGMLWPELLTLEHRDAMPIRVTREDYDRLNRQVFPFWIDRSVVDEASRASGRRSLIGWIAGARPIHLGEQEGPTGASPDFAMVLRRGLLAVMQEAEEARGVGTPDQADSHQAASIAISGVLDYAGRLADQAEIEARGVEDPARRQELMEAALSCRRCPSRPAETLIDALHSIRIIVAALHQESMNEGLCLGRLDVLLQPYLERETAGCADGPSRDLVLKRAVERVACFLLSLADHVPLVAASVEPMRSGCRGCEAITLGGVREDGTCATCDMTYVILKASEMLGLPNPRIHVRYHARSTPDYLLRRACEVALLTGAGPSIHGDEVTTRAMESLGIQKSRAWDWAIAGSVSPTVVGEHLARPLAVTVDLVAALEMALNDGEHPQLAGVTGPCTGAADTIESMPDMLDALSKQFEALIEMAFDGCASIDVAVESVAPMPLLSSLIGGVHLDTSSVAVVGLSEVVDSLAAIDELVFHRKSLAMGEVLAGMAEDFLGTPTLHESLCKEGPKYGGGSDRVLSIAQRTVAMIHEVVRRHRSSKGGRWVASYGGLSAFVGFGRMTGALPSGRRAGEFGAPGIGPSMSVGTTAAQRIVHGASLHTRHMLGGALFEAMIPGEQLDHADHVDRIVSHVRAFLHQGGMHVQVATLDASQLRRAEEEPVVYRDTLVPICGYDAYLPELPEDLRVWMLRRAE